MPAKCPKCDNAIVAVNLEQIDANLITRTYRAVAYTCQRCHAVLSVGLDPIALKSDVVTEVVDALRKG